jgi:hypothetical protein
MNVLDSRCSVLTSLVYDFILKPRARMIQETIFGLEFVSDCFLDDPGNYILAFQTCQHATYILNLIRSYISGLH